MNHVEPNHPAYTPTPPEPRYHTESGKFYYQDDDYVEQVGYYKITTEYMSFKAYRIIEAEFDVNGGHVTNQSFIESFEAWAGDLIQWDCKPTFK